MSDEILYVVTGIFNPFRFKSRVDLYKRFEKYIEFSGAVLITVEVVLNDQTFECTKPNHKNHIQLHTESIIWHKECLLNVGIEYVRKTYPNAGKVAWIDADIQFTNPNWVNDTLFSLEKYSIIQLFSHILWLNHKNVSESQKPGFIFNYSQQIIGGHPGFAWASRIEILEKVGGLIDFCIHGSADTIMSFAWIGQKKYDAHTSNIELKDNSTPIGYKERIDEYKSRCDKVVKKSIGYIHGTCFHYWHGKLQSRGYNERYLLIQNHKFNPNTDLIRETNGLYKWAGNKPEMENDFRLSLLERNEDEII